MIKRKPIPYLCLMAILVLLCAAKPAAAASPTPDSQGIQVVLNGSVLTFDVPPRAQNGYILLPLRAIFEAMGATVAYDASAGTVTAAKGNTTVNLAFGSNSPTINGQIVRIEQPAIAVDGKTLAPLRFVAEAFGGQVVWDGAANTAAITTAAEDKPVAPSDVPNQPQKPEEQQPEAGDYRTESFAGIMFKIKSSWKTLIIDKDHEVAFFPLSDQGMSLAETSYIACTFDDIPSGLITDENSETIFLAMLIDNYLTSSKNSEEISRVYFKVGDQPAVRFSLSVDSDDGSRNVADVVAILFEDGFITLGAVLTESAYEDPTYNQIIETTLSSVELDTQTMTNSL